MSTTFATLDPLRVPYQRTVIVAVTSGPCDHGQRLRALSYQGVR